MTEKEFLQLAKTANLIPVYQEISSDLLTPVSAYLQLSKGAKYSFLLESVEGQEKVARYSIMANRPEMVIRSKDDLAQITTFDAQGKAKTEKIDVIDSPMNIIRDILDQYDPAQIKGLPQFYGGFVGYLSYDMVRFFEPVPSTAKDDLQCDDMVLMMAKELVIFDHLHHVIKVVSCVHVDPVASQATKKKAYAQAIKKISALIKTLEQPVKDYTKNSSTIRKHRCRVKSNISADRYTKMVTQAKKHIRAGDIIQVVLSQRLEVDVKTHPLNIYRSLRTLNPSPYMYLLNLDGMNIVGSSPELLVRVEEGLAETRPIAGTRPRGQTQAEDLNYEKDLLADPKEIAEHIMLVDLGRNDLGRVCKQGTINVSEFMTIERYSHVMHIVSNVQGQLRDDQDAIAVLESSFPAGTLSGAPKIRAMEIIDDLENEKRGPYGGCIGWFGFSDNMDTCITIRTIVIKDGKAYVQAGAGIVADSKPKKEYEETMNKARAQVRAIEIAHKK